MKYTVYKLNTIAVCVPSGDFYARGNDWQTEDIQVLVKVDSFDTMEEATAHVKNITKDQYTTGTYTILPTFEI